MFEIDYIRENLNKGLLKKFVIWILAAIVWFSLGYIFSEFLKENSPNKGGEKLKVVSSISDKIPRYSDFIQVGSHTSSRSFDACTYDNYKSKTKYDEVKFYYENLLIKNNWIQENQDILKFQKGEYSIVIEHNFGNYADWNYSISTCWKNPN